MPQPPDSVALELRAAVLAGNHKEAARLTVEYSESVREHWMALSDREREASTLPRLSNELLTWVRDMTLMQQAMAAQHLALVDRARRDQAARSTYLQCASDA